MISESQLSYLCQHLSQFNDRFCLARLVPGRKTSHSPYPTNAVDKLHQPAAISQPRFKPQANINANPLRELLKQQGAQLATLESLANDKTNVIDKLSALAAKRAAKLTEISTAINALKNLSGTLYSMQLTGSAQTIATQLKQAAVPNNNQHTIASLLLSSQPLTFFEELLCSA